MRIGVDSRPDKEKLKNLEENTVLWTAEYDAGSGTVTGLPLLFRGYIKAPSKSEEAGVWGKVVDAVKNSDGTYSAILISDGKDSEPKESTHVTDLSIGVWFNPKDAIVAFKAEMEKVVKACDEAIKEYE